jgi:hypothetical protein
MTEKDKIVSDLYKIIDYFEKNKTEHYEEIIHDCSYFIIQIQITDSKINFLYDMAIEDSKEIIFYAMREGIL